MNDSHEPSEDPDDEPSEEQIQVKHVSARVPEHVSRGAFSTGAIVMTGPNEFIIDFVQHLGGPPSVAARVVMPHAVMPQFVAALNTNLEMYRKSFGNPPQLPRGAGERPPSVRDLYDELKLPDSMLSGAYCNGVMIAHSPAEFRFDFLTNLIPTSAVSARVFLSAPHVPRLLNSLATTWKQFQKRIQQQRESNRPPEEPPESEDSSDEFE